MTAQVSRPTPPASRINGDTNRTGTPIGQERSWPDPTNRRPYGLRPSWPRSGVPLSPLRKLRRQLLYPSRAVERCAASPTSRSHTPPRPRPQRCLPRPHHLRTLCEAAKSRNLPHNAALGNNGAAEVSVRGPVAPPAVKTLLSNEQIMAGH